MPTPPQLPPTVCPHCLQSNLILSFAIFQNVPPLVTINYPICFHFPKLNNNPQNPCIAHCALSLASHLPAETEARPQTRHRYPVRRSILPLLLSGLSQTRTVSHPAPKATGPLLWPASSLGPAPTQQLQLRTTVTTTRVYYVLRLCTMGTLNWACFHHIRIHADTCL